jgi:hypothetical protein
MSESLNDWGDPTGTLPKSAEMIAEGHGDPPRHLLGINGLDLEIVQMRQVVNLPLIGETAPA